MAKIVHFEIPVDDAQRAGRFYGDVLGWQINGYGDEPYWLVTAGPDEEPGANGALLARGDLHRSPVLIAGVDNLDAALQRAQAAGGLVVQGKLAIPGIGWSAYVTDTEGNTIGLFQPDGDAS